MPAVKAAPAKKRQSRRDSDSTPLMLQDFRPPQLATLERRVPAGDNWLFEIKFDGYRCQAAIAGDQVRLYTRNGHDWTRRFGFVAPALATLTKGTALIDGEICAMDDAGRTNFTLLKNSLDGKQPVGFYAFGRLEHFRDAGFTCLEIMPVNEFPGKRNWGHDGTLLFAPESAYGTREELRMDIPCGVYGSPVWTGEYLLRLGAWSAVAW